MTTITLFTNAILTWYDKLREWFLNSNQLWRLDLSVLLGAAL